MGVARHLAQRQHEPSASVPPLPRGVCRVGGHGVLRDRHDQHVSLSDMAVPSPPGASRTGLMTKTLGAATDNALGPAPPDGTVSAGW